MSHPLPNHTPANETSAVTANLLQITSRISASIGIHFFQSMAKNLSKALAADCVFIGEFVGGQSERVRTLAAWRDLRHDAFTYTLAGSASAQIALGKPCICRSHARKRFPNDEIFRTLSVEACVGIPLLNSSGIPIGLIMTVYHKSITDPGVAESMLEILAPRAAAELERKQEEERIRQSEERHRVFVTLNPDPMWRIEFEPPVPTSLPEQEQMERIFRDGFLAECNDALARHFGAKPGDLIGLPIGKLVPLSSPAIRNSTLSAIRSGYRFTTVETAPISRDGKPHYMLRSQWGIVDDGLLQRVWGSNRDITDLKQSEIALDAADQRIAGLLENLPLLVVMVLSDRKIAFCNEQFARRSGYREQDAVGQDFLELMIPEEERARVRAALHVAETDAKRHVHFESQLLAANGDRPWIAWDSTALRDSDGSVAATAIVGCDITPFKKLATRFELAQRLEHIGRMAGGIAHDFNNLLTIIIAHTAALLEKKSPSDPDNVSLQQILKAAETAADLTQRLFAFSCRRAVKPEVLNPATLIAEDVPMVQQLAGEQIRIATNLDPATGLVLGDAGHLHQIILNLAVNARDAMPNGGTLAFSTSNTDAGHVQLTVTDTGVGMNDEVRNHLFEPFFTTKPHGKGTGLGLSTVYGAVQQSGGRIEVESHLGAGTSFHIFLPRVHEDAAPALKPRVPGMLPRGSETILLVEDQPEVRNIAAGILRDLGYRVLEASGVTQALEYARQASGETIHLLMTVLMLPGASGGELADAIKTSWRNMKVLFLSPFIGPLDGQRELTERGFAWLQKPFTPESLSVAVRELLDQS
jgi:PAS domain S-box-containing protein